MRSEFSALFLRASKSMRAAGETAMRRHGLHLGQNLVLEALWERDGRTPGEIAQLLHVTTPTVVKMATRMTAAGFLVRRRDDADNRLVRLYLTDLGRSLREPVMAEMEHIDRHVTADLTAEERRHLQTALAKMVRALEALGTEPVDHTHEV